VHSFLIKKPADILKKIKCLHSKNLGIIIQMQKILGQEEIKILSEDDFFTDLSPE
jgi:hypothetical protein